MGATGVAAAVVCGIASFWIYVAKAEEQHAPMAVSAYVIATARVDARLIARSVAAPEGTVERPCASLTLSSSNSTTTRVSFRAPDQAQALRSPRASNVYSFDLCPSAVMTLSRSSGGHAPPWQHWQTATADIFDVAVEY